MYPVSLDYQEKIKSDDRLFECKIQIDHSHGTLYLTDKDLVLGSLSFTEATQPREQFTTGGTVASDISFTILNKPEYEDIKFIGATVFVNIGLQIYEGIDAHFLQPSQPSKMKGFDEKWEYVPLGIFHIDEVNRQRNTIELKAIDNMIKLDKPYSLSKLTYPATLYEIYVNACNVCNIPIGTTSFPNMNYVVQEKPEGDYSFRDIIGHVAELAGCFAKCNRNGALELKWYEQTDIELGPMNRFNFKPSDDTVKITGVMYGTEDTVYLAGTDEYVIDLSENPLVSGDYSTLLNNIYNNIKDTVFTPYTSEWQGNPAIEAGDMITQIDGDGNVYNTIVTKSTYKYRGRSILEAKGLPELTKGYKGTVEKFKSTANKQIAQAKNIAEEAKEIGEEAVEQISLVEQVRTNVNNLMANMLGGYFIEDRDNGILYVADSPNLNQATKIWRWGLGGFGYSDDGGQTWKTAITADGSIVAMLVAANIITADMVRTGLLQSENGELWINLDNGYFNLKNIIYDDKGFRILYEGEELISVIDNLASGLYEVDSKVGQIQLTADELKVDMQKYNKGILEGETYSFDGDRFQIGSTGSGNTVAHTNENSIYRHEDGSYTKIGIDGLERYIASKKFSYNYLVYVGEVEIKITGKPSGDKVIVQLPDEFKGKNFKIFTSMKTFDLPWNYLLVGVYTWGFVDSMTKGTAAITAVLSSTKVNIKLGKIKSVAGEDITGYWLESPMEVSSSQGTVKVQYIVIA